MTNLRKISMAAVLALMLAPATLAGITDTPPTPGPTPEPSPMTATDETVDTLSAQPTDTAIDPVVEVALDLMQSLLSLL
jgi:hypothetical protein